MSVSSQVFDFIDTDSSGFIDEEELMEGASVRQVLPPHTSNSEIIFILLEDLRVMAG